MATPAHHVPDAGAIFVRAFENVAIDTTPASQFRGYDDRVLSDEEIETPRRTAEQETCR